MLVERELNGDRVAQVEAFVHESRCILNQLPYRKRRWMQIRERAIR